MILVSTTTGCRAFSETGEFHQELAGKAVSALAPEPCGGCLALVNQQELWRRAPTGEWAHLTTVDLPLQSLLSVNGAIFAGGDSEAVLIRVAPNQTPERLPGFDEIEGRQEWFAGGPPLGVRSLAATADAAILLAAVHVGGLPRSTNGGTTWIPTIPVLFDVHEVRAHPTQANILAAAAAVGLCTSLDAGRTWSLVPKDFQNLTSLALAILPDQVLFSVQSGPFAKCSQVWRWPIGGEHVEPVRDGLPESLAGKIDTGHIAAGAGRAAICDGEGNLWLSQENARAWQRIATELYNAQAVLIL